MREVNREREIQRAFFLVVVVKSCSRLRCVVFVFFVMMMMTTIRKTFFLSCAIKLLFGNNTNSKNWYAKPLLTIEVSLVLSKNFKKPSSCTQKSFSDSFSQKKLSLSVFLRIQSLLLLILFFFCRWVVTVPSFSHVWVDGKSVLRVIRARIFKSAEAVFASSSSWIIIIILILIRWWKWWWANTTANEFLKPQSSNHFWTTTHRKSWEDHPQK